MAITLRVTSNQAQFMGDDAEVTFTGQCRVGRGSHNDFVLNDPDRIVSSDHVTLMESDDQWSLHDTSTNGTTINGQTASRGAPTPLKSGDVLGIGTYQVEVVVSLASAGAALPGPTVADPQFPPGMAPSVESPASPADLFGGSDPFASQDSPAGQPPAADQDLFGTPDPFATPPAAPDVGFPPPAGSVDPLAPGVSPLDAGIDAQSLNPLDHFGEAGLDPLAKPAGGVGGLGIETPPIADPFEPLLGAQPDNVPADQHLFEPPPIAPPADLPAGIPGLDDAGGAGGGIPADWMAQSEPDVSGPEPSAMPNAGPQGVAGFSPQLPGELAGQSPQAHSPHPQAQPFGGAGDLSALWRAAGLDPATVDPAAAQSMGEILLVVVQGMMEVLRARAEIKNQFRVAMTMLKPADNNPLKLATTPQDALAKLFGPAGQGYQDPLVAFQEGFRDIRNHQVAMLYAMQSGFNAVQQHYDPDKLEQRFDRGLKRSSLLGVVNKTKYWELYRDMVDQLGDGDEAFRELFGETFAIAYEEQLGRLERGQ